MPMLLLQLTALCKWKRKDSAAQNGRRIIVGSFEKAVPVIFKATSREKVAVPLVTNRPHPVPWHFRTSRHSVYSNADAKRVGARERHWPALPL